MFPSTTAEVYESLKQAKNLNSAVKKILKQEVKRGSPEERFFKDFRNIATSPRCGELLEGFVEKHHPEHERYLMVVAGYAYDEPMMQITGDIIDAYADDFNKTYETNDSKVEIKDPENFERIARAAYEMIEKGLISHSLPSSPFLKSVLMNRLFTPEVIEKLRPLFQ